MAEQRRMLGMNRGVTFSVGVHDLGQPFAQIDARFGVGQVVDENDGLVVGEEDVSSNGMRFVATHIPHFDEECLLFGCPFGKFVTFHLNRTANRPAWIGFLVLIAHQIDETRLADTGIAQDENFDLFGGRHFRLICVGGRTETKEGRN